MPPTSAADFADAAFTVGEPPDGEHATTINSAAMAAA
jgi:hypothetical protein